MHILFIYSLMFEKSILTNSKSYKWVEIRFYACLFHPFLFDVRSRVVKYMDLPNLSKILCDIEYRKFVVNRLAIYFPIVYHQSCFLFSRGVQFLWDFPYGGRVRGVRFPNYFIVNEVLEVVVVTQG